MSEGLRVERDGPVTTVVLDRPERLNALSYSLIRGLRATLDELREDLAQRVVVLTGAGRAFSAGIDLKEQAAGEVWNERGGRVQERYALQQAVADLVAGLRRIPQPVIAVVTGVAAGGGLSLACAADIRIAEPAAAFSAAFVRIGASGGDLGSSYFLPRIVGWDLAAEMLYTGRTVDAQEAERIGGLLRNGPGYLEVILGCARIGAIFVPLNPLLTAPELRILADDAGLSALVTDASFTAVLGPLDSLIGAERIFFGGDPPASGRSLRDLHQHGTVPDDRDVDPADPMLICYTSGTTGRPKGAVLTHANLEAVAAGAIAFDALSRDDRAIITVPLAFTGAGVSVAVPFLRCGGSLVIRHEFVPARVLDDIEDDGVTFIGVVPLILERMAAEPGFGDRDLSGLRVAKVGGAPVPEHLLRLYAGRGVGLVNAYALTEGSGLNLELQAHEALRKLGSVGIPLLGQEARVVNADGGQADPGEPGELLLAGSTVMKEYWRNPQATAETLRDGWLHTGDIASMDDEGYFRIMDRAKDMIISGGINIYPAEIEAVLGGHPDVAEIAVVGVPDEAWGEPRWPAS